MPFDITAADLLLSSETFKPKPFFKGWNRLEGRVRTEEFERALRAEARDPLWFLARQWQFLELKADDAGSPIEARLALRQRKLALYAARENPAQGFPTDLPLETVVEREAPPLDRLALVQIHRALDKILVRAGLDAGQRQSVHTAMRTAYPLDPAIIEGVEDDEARQMAIYVDEHLFDAARFLDDPDVEGTIGSTSGLTGALAQSAKTAAFAAKSWYQNLYITPTTPDDNAWAPDRLEYQFSCATAPDDDQTVLVGDSYSQGRLDWFAVDVATATTRLGGDVASSPEPIEEAVSFVPTALRFAGMPSHRFWEMENRKIDFGAITAQPTDIAKLLLTEFMLAYSNDWCLVPCEVEVGSLSDVQGLVVHDVFGDVTLIRRADRGMDEDWRRWSMFGLQTRDEGDVANPSLFMPPSTPHTMEGPPIERVTLLRDEMANMVWAVERTILSASGIGIDGERFAAAIEVPGSPDPEPAPGAAIRYRLGTDAPPHWRPFIPVHVPGSIRSVRLQRARLPHGNRDPLGVILIGPGLAPEPYYLNEEEAPRAGRIVTRSFQRTRWLDGRIVIWLGRRTATGRGPGESGLQFDVIEELGPAG
jgi:hypothetical protein